MWKGTNMYMSMYMGASSSTPAPAPTPAPTPTRAEQAKPSVARATSTQSNVTPSKIYLRVPDMSGEAFKKAKNMVDIFNEGTIRVIFYDQSTSKYSQYSERMFFSNVDVKELKKILGDDNVVLK